MNEQTSLRCEEISGQIKNTKRSLGCHSKPKVTTRKFSSPFCLSCQENTAHSLFYTRCSPFLKGLTPLILSLELLIISTLEDQTKTTPLLFFKNGQPSFLLTLLLKFFASPLLILPKLKPCLLLPEPLFC